MAAKRKYYNLIKVIHEEWCVANGYPIGRKPFFSSGKLRKAQKIPVSGTPNRFSGSVEKCSSAQPQVVNQNLVQVLKHQAASGKATSTSVKLQAASSKLLDPRTTVQEN